MSDNPINRDDLSGISSDAGEEINAAHSQPDTIANESPGNVPLMVDSMSNLVEAPAGKRAPKSATGCDPSSDTEPPTKGSLNSLYLQIEALVDERSEKLLNTFEDKLAYDASKQRQIDQLHAELQEHRADLLGKAVHPYVHGMITLHDTIRKQAEAFRAKPERITTDCFFEVLEGLQEDIEIHLSNFGITAYRELGNSFDSKRQRVLKKVGSSDETDVGRIANSIRPGFERDAHILEKEGVSVYVSESDAAAKMSASSKPENHVSSESQRKQNAEGD